MSQFKSSRQYVPCPHTGAGLHAAVHYLSTRTPPSTSPVPVVAMATAHPGKFGDTVTDVVGSDGKPLEPLVPDCLRAVLSAPKRCLSAANSVDAVRDIVTSVCSPVHLVVE